MVPLAPSCSPSLAMERAQILLESWGDTARVTDVFLASLTATLSRYPEAVVLRVTDPVFGLVRQLKFFPKVADVVEACEAEMEPYYAAARRELEAERTAELVAGIDGDPDEVRARATAAWEAIRDSVKAARPPNEDATAQPKPKPVETFLETLNRVRTSGPVMVGSELRKKLDAIVLEREKLGGSPTPPRRGRKKAAA